VTHILRHPLTFKVTLFAALAALVLSTCVAASGSSGLPLADGEGGIAISEVPGNGDSPLDNPAEAPPAPSKGQPSGSVDPAAPSSELAAAPPATQVSFPRLKRVLQPRLRVAGVTDPAVVAKLRKMDGITYAAGFEVAQIGVGSTGKAVTVAAIDPVKFRKLTPEITANAPAVWQRIVEGDAAFTHDVGNQLKQELKTDLGGFVPAGASGHALRVGAYASNGIPPIADALVSHQTAQALGMTGRQDVLVALDADADTEAVRQRIAQVARAEVAVLEDPQELRAYLSGEDARSQFEPYNYVDMGDGMIQIDPDWVARNIVRRAMPLLKGEVVCHRQMVDQLYGALAEIEREGLGHLIDPSQYGGCWVPRHIDFNPAKPLSMHSWGLAADFNVSTNGLGMKPQMDPRVVHIFDKWGFVWGGRWSRPDGMHFELGAVLDNSPQG
jgi:hypothetical protein